MSDLIKHELISLYYNVHEALKNVLITSAENSTYSNKVVGEWAKRAIRCRRNKKDRRIQLVFSEVSQGDGAFHEIRTSLKTKGAKVQHPTERIYYMCGDGFLSRTAILEQLAGSITEEDVAEKFPDATNIFSFHQSDSSLGNAVVEFKDEQELCNRLDDEGGIVTVGRQELEMRRMSERVGYVLSRDENETKLMSNAQRIRKCFLLFKKAEEVQKAVNQSDIFGDEKVVKCRSIFAEIVGPLGELIIDTDKRMEQNHAFPEGQEMKVMLQNIVKQLKESDDEEKANIELEDEDEEMAEEGKEHPPNKKQKGSDSDDMEDEYSNDMRKRIQEMMNERLKARQSACDAMQTEEEFKVSPDDDNDALRSKIQSFMNKRLEKRSVGMTEAGGGSDVKPLIAPEELGDDTQATRLKIQAIMNLRLKQREEGVQKYEGLLGSAPGAVPGMRKRKLDESSKPVLPDIKNLSKEEARKKIQEAMNSRLKEEARRKIQETMNSRLSQREQSTVTKNDPMMPPMMNADPYSPVPQTNLPLDPYSPVPQTKLPLFTNTPSAATAHGISTPYPGDSMGLDEIDLEVRERRLRMRKEMLETMEKEMEERNRYSMPGTSGGGDGYNQRRKEMLDRIEREMDIYEQSLRDVGPNTAAAGGGKSMGYYGNSSFGEDSTGAYSSQTGYSNRAGAEQYGARNRDTADSSTGFYKNYYKNTHAAPPPPPPQQQQQSYGRGGVAQTQMYPSGGRSNTGNNSSSGGFSSSSMGRNGQYSNTTSSSARMGSGIGSGMGQQGMSGGSSGGYNTGQMGSGGYGSSGHSGMQMGRQSQGSSGMGQQRAGSGGYNGGQMGGGSGYGSSSGMNIGRQTYGAGMGQQKGMGGAGGYNAGQMSGYGGGGMHIGRQSQGSGMQMGAGRYRGGGGGDSPPPGEACRWADSQRDDKTLNVLKNMRDNMYSTLQYF